MSTKEDSPYDPVQFKIMIPRWLSEEFRLFVSRKWPSYQLGSLSIEGQLALKMWLENEKGLTHTHKTSVLSEAENKPNWHTCKKGVRVPEAIPVPNPNPNAIVLTSGGQRQESQSDSDSSFFGWANRLGVVITSKHRELARKTLTDLVFRKEKFTEYNNRLIARRNQSISKTVNSKVSERKKENIEKMREIILLLNDDDLIDKEGRTPKEDFKNAVSLVYGVKDHRPIKAIIRNLISGGEIVEARLSLHIRGKPLRMTHYQIIDKDMLLK
jgi:hypothetical protein